MDSRSKAAHSMGSVTTVPGACGQAYHLQEEAQLQAPIVLEVGIHVQALVHALHAGTQVSLPHTACATSHHHFTHMPHA